MCAAIFPQKTMTSVCLGFFLHPSSMVPRQQMTNRYSRRKTTFILTILTTQDLCLNSPSCSLCYHLKKPALASSYTYHYTLLNTYKSWRQNVFASRHSWEKVLTTLLERFRSRLYSSYIYHYTVQINRGYKMSLHLASAERKCWNVIRYSIQ